MQVEITPRSFFRILDELQSSGVAHEWKSITHDGSKGNRLLSQQLASDDWAGPGVVINQLLLSDGTIKVSYHVDIAKATSLASDSEPDPYQEHTCQMLQISTGNIQHTTAEHLGSDGTVDGVVSTELNAMLMPAKWGSYGFIIYTGFDMPEKYVKVYPELAALLTFAKSKGFQFLKLDRDATPLAGFPTFEW